MRTYSFTLSGARLAYLLTITRVDGTIIRVTGYSKSITIGSNTWVPDPGLEFGDITESNAGEVPVLSLKFAIGGQFSQASVLNGAFEGAECLLEICNAANPTTKDEEFRGILKGESAFDLGGRGRFEIFNKFALLRDVFVRKYTKEDDVDFGDPRRSKIPTFPTVDITSDDLADVGRNEAISDGERRRFRYASADNPSDYHNVYWQAEGTGTTGGSAPVSPSDTPGATVSDGGVTWRVYNAYARAFQVASIIDANHITITVTEPRATVVTWFAPGMIVMRSGLLTGRASGTDVWDGTSELRLEVPFANYLEVGDWGEIAPHYDQTLLMAVDKYGNAYNYRGFPYIGRTVVEPFVTTYYIALAGNGSILAGKNVRAIIDSARLSTSGTTVRITLRSGSTLGATVESMWIGHQAASGDVYDFDGNQVQVTFNEGDETVAIATASTAVTDPIAFALDETRDLIIAFVYTSGGAAGQVGVDADTTAYYKVGADESHVTDVSGYADWAQVHLVEKIEVY